MLQNGGIFAILPEILVGEVLQVFQKPGLEYAFTEDAISLPEVFEAGEVFENFPFSVQTDGFGCQG